LTDQNFHQKIMRSKQTMWRLWAKAIGEKAHKKDHIADQIAAVRTVIFLSYLVTNLFIVAGVIRHWNDEPVHIYIESADGKERVI